MKEAIVVPDLAHYGAVPQDSILSSTLQSDATSKLILFRFAVGQELSAHTAPFPAALYFVAGEAVLTLGGERSTAAAGTLVYMPSQLEHSVQAVSEVVMLLTLFKGAGGQC